MKCLTTTHWARLLTGVFLTLLVREAVAPARASASSCGDYVTVTNPANLSTQRPMPVKPSPPPGNVPHDPPAPGKAPCHAPSCPGGPALPAPPASFGRDAGQERWDCLLTPPAFHSTVPFGLPLLEYVLKPYRLPSSIFHPPLLTADLKSEMRQDAGGAPHPGSACPRPRAVSEPKGYGPCRAAVPAASRFA
jgi:hypothetical protein